MAPFFPTQFKCIPSTNKGKLKHLHLNHVVSEIPQNESSHENLSLFCLTVFWTTMAGSTTRDQVSHCHDLNVSRWILDDLLMRRYTSPFDLIKLDMMSQSIPALMHTVTKISCGYSIENIMINTTYCTLILKRELTISLREFVLCSVMFLFTH